MKLLVVVLILVVVYLSQARHIHPGFYDPDKLMFEQIEGEKPDIPIDVLRNFKQSRFVPLNSVIFFKSFEPCPDGFKRDVLGICREVWD